MRNEPAPTERRSLVKRITTSIAITALVAMLLQVAIVGARLYFDKQDIAVAFVAHGTNDLRHQLTVRGGEILLKKSHVPRQYRSGDISAYAFRIMTEAGRVVAEHNGGVLASTSPWGRGSGSDQDMWIVNLDRNERLHVAGGQRFRIAGTLVLVEIASYGDPSMTALSVLATEIVDDVWMPMIPMLVLTMGLTILLVRRSMRPLADLAAQAQSPSLPASAFRIAQQDAPQEVETLVRALNNLLVRVRSLMRAQDAFVARVAHELRTPLAAMMLEAERAAESGPGKLMNDVKGMSLMVERLLTLTRLQNTEAQAQGPLDLVSFAEDVMSQFNVLAKQTGHRLSLVAHPPFQAAGDADALFHLLRNLIENAIRHTPAGTTIQVTVGPGAKLAVSDNGPGWGAVDKARLLDPFVRGRSSPDGTGLGLAIVREAAERLSAELTLDASEAGGARVLVDWSRGSPAGCSAQDGERAGK